MSEMSGRLLRETLQAGMSSESPGCLDAETVARWADDTLTRKERAAVEAHAAGCARCQPMLAAMARTAPPAVARSWFRSPIVAWVAPLTAVAAALLVYVSVTPRSPSPAPAATAATRARAAGDVVPELRAPVPVGQERQADQADLSAEARNDRTRAKVDQATEADKRAVAETRTRDAREARGAAMAKALPSPVTAPPAAAERPRVVAPATVAELAAPAPLLPPASPAATLPPPTLASPAPQVAAAPPADARAAALPAASSAAPRAAVAGGVASRDESLERGNAARMLALSARRPASTIVIPSSTTSSRWRVISTVVQRSTDGGTTWEDTQPTGASAAPTAGASPSPLVCWLVGPRGLVLLSTDGRTWKRPVFPETVDLTSVLAMDDARATVTTADGRTFATTDRGISWIRR